MSKTSCVPLELVKLYSKKYSKCWEKINFDEKECYQNMVTMITQSNKNNISMNDLMTECIKMMIFGTWRRNKQIYRFYKELEELLYDQTDDVLSKELLNCLPYPCIYVETNTLIEYDIVGFFVCCNTDSMSDASISLDGLDVLILCVEEDGSCTIFPFLRHVVAKQILNNFHDNDGKKEYLEPSHRIRQLILYLCAQNAEINQINKRIYKKIPGRIKDQYKEIQQFECGKKTSEIIRKTMKIHSSKQQNETLEMVYIKKNGSKKRPHVRKGHWHRYWIGSKKEKNRQIKLNWIAPSIIHQEIFNEEENPVVINQIIDEQ